MILEIFQFACCLLLVVSAIRWRAVKGTGTTAIRLIRILGTVAGICGLMNLYCIGMEFFIASYSGAMYEIKPPSNLVLLGVISAMALTTLPLLCVFPNMVRDPKRVIWIGSISLASLLGLWMFRQV